MRLWPTCIAKYSTFCKRPGTNNHFASARSVFRDFYLSIFSEYGHFWQTILQKTINLTERASCLPDSAFLCFALVWTVRIQWIRFENLTSHLLILQGKEQQLADQNRRKQTGSMFSLAEPKYRCNEATVVTHPTFYHLGELRSML